MVAKEEEMDDRVGREDKREARARYMVLRLLGPCHWCHWRLFSLVGEGLGV